MSLSCKTIVTLQLEFDKWCWNIPYQSWCLYLRTASFYAWLADYTTCYSILHPFVVFIFVFSEFFLHLCISSGQFAFPGLTLHCLTPVILPACVQLFPHRFLLLLSRLHNVPFNCRDPVSGRWQFHCNRGRWDIQTQIHNVPQTEAIKQIQGSSWADNFPE